MSEHLPPAESREDLQARVAWSAIAEPGDAVANRLISGVGPVRALAALRERSESALDRFRPRLERLDVDGLLAATQECGARIITPADPEWPPGVNDLPAPPLCLWVRGSARLAETCRRSVAVVGARAATAYGESVAADLAAELCDRDVSVVSGAAFGIDAAAHRGALAAGGCTVAVLAGGVDRPYPAAHHRLLGHIAERGAVVSESPPGSVALRSRFLQRNRLIAAMTRGTVVVEAGLRSGSRNTAGTAASLHRVVMAVPGPVTSMSSVGCHELIRSGKACLVTDASEVTELIGEIGADLAPTRRSPQRPGDDLEGEDRRVFEALPRRGGLETAELAVKAGLAVSSVQTSLGFLELNGLARRTERGWRTAS
ncbi:DNA-processing protein DprA [Gephyromycinifex aptenodytis]|uniref:DNA-processing protein DprA n=1 Tax=Gephyromycinifex aptenodytis TaxID=2716227 RepID=UPI001446370A|nr:DNA-processing protein DprA [Gephyromycinifex aptenodytis]